MPATSEERAGFSISRGHDYVAEDGYHESETEVLIMTISSELSWYG